MTTPPFRRLARGTAGNSSRPEVRQAPNGGVKAVLLVTLVLAGCLFTGLASAAAYTPSPRAAAIEGWKKFGYIVHMSRGCGIPDSEMTGLAQFYSVERTFRSVAQDFVRKGYLKPLDWGTAADIEMAYQDGEKMAIQEGPRSSEKCRQLEASLAPLDRKIAEDARVLTRLLDRLKMGNPDVEAGRPFRAPN